MFGRVDIMGNWNVGIVYPESMDLISNEPQISVEQVLYGRDLTKNGCRQMLQPKHEECGIEEIPCAEVLITCLFDAESVLQVCFLL